MNTATQPLDDLTENDVPAMAGTLQDLLSEISSRVNLADARYVDIIGEMQGKLAALDGLAKSARAKAEETARLEAQAEAKRRADEEASAEAKRIEEAENARKRTADAEAAEAERLAKAVQAAKAAAAAAIESTASRAYQGEVDTFDIIDHAPARPREPWDTESANVFIRHFEQMDPPGMLQPRRSSGIFYPEPQVPVRHSVTQNAVATIGDDRVWLEGRFNDIASRISEMMTSGTTRELGNRFDHLEDRIDAAMTTVTAQAENGAGTLKQIEAHIAEIDEHVDYIRKELSRLDIVEAHIRGLMERQNAADAAYQEAHAALPTPQANDAQEGIVQLTGLLQRLVEERKHTEEHTIAMLDTLQQAMIRVLDRMDAIEAGAEGEQEAPAADAHHDHYHAEHEHPEAEDQQASQQAPPQPTPAQQAPAAAPQRQHQPQHHHLTPPAHAQHPPRHPQQSSYAPPRHEFFDFEIDEAQADMTRAAQLAADEAANAAAQTQQTPSSNIGQIRRNLISEAQRARHGGQGGDAGATQQNATQSAARAAQAQTRASILERIMRPNSKHLAIAALALMIPLNAMFLYLVLGSSKSPEPADFHTATEMPLSPERYTEASRAIASEPPVSKAADPLPPEDLGRISPPLSSEPVAHQTTTEAPAGSGAIELPPANVGPLTLRKAAADGDPSAQFEVAARLAEGKGIDQDFKTAVLWYQRSASRGFAQSQYRIGTHYERGLGVEKDPERAKVWYQRAAEQGNVKAMHNLAVLSTNRPDGKPDYAEALKWFTEAANYNLPDSQFNLAVLHESGLGTAKDPKTAYVWFSLAARSGDREASRRREATKAQLSADAVAAADDEVKNFRPKAQSPVINDPRTAGEQWKRRQVTEN